MYMTEKRIDDLIENMPHGSGINYDYYWTKSQGKLLLHNAFYNYNEAGYGEGASAFTVHLILKNDGEWILDKIRFSPSKTNSNIYRKYSNSILKDYLYDTYQWAIDEHNTNTSEFNDEMIDFEEPYKLNIEMNYND